MRDAALHVHFYQRLQPRADDNVRDVSHMLKPSMPREPERSRPKARAIVTLTCRQNEHARSVERSVSETLTYYAFRHPLAEDPHNNLNIKINFNLI